MLVKLFRGIKHVELLYFLDKETGKHYSFYEYKEAKKALKKGQHIVAMFSFYGVLLNFCSSRIRYIGKRYYMTSNGLYRYHNS